MQVQSEIDKKEKTLGELMGRILKEPFKPVNDSIKDIKETLLNTQDKVSEVQDCINVLIEDSETATKKLARTLNKLRDENFPDLTYEIQNQISIQTKQITESLDQHNIKLQTITSDVLEYFNEAVNQRNKLEQSVFDLKTQIVLASEKQFTATSTAKDVTLNTLNEIRTFITLMEANHTTFKNQVTVSSELITRNIKASITQLNSILAEQKTFNLAISQTVLPKLNLTITRQDDILTAISDLGQQSRAANEAVQSELAAIAKDLHQENTNLTKSSLVTHTKLKILTTTIFIFFGLMITYVGYDIWNKLH